MTKRILKPNTTQTPDLILDNLPAFSNAELRVCLVVIRSTLGWNKESDWLTQSQVVKRAGMSRASISPAIGSLVERSILLVRDEDGNALDTPAKRKAIGEAHRKIYYALNVEGPVQILDSSPTPPVQELDRPCPDPGKAPVQILDTTTPTQDNTQTLQETETPADRIINRLNELREASWQWAQFRPLKATKANAEHINGRLGEGHPEAGLVLVLEYLAAKDAGDEKSRQFFDCVTPFRTANFDRYLTLAEDWDAKGRPSLNRTPPGWARDDRSKLGSEFSHVTGVAKRDDAAGQVWDEVVATLKATIPDTSYRTWLADAVPFELSNGSFKLVAPDGFTASGIKSRYRSEIERLLSDVRGEPTDLVIEVRHT